MIRFVVALFSLTGRLERARREKAEPSALDLLQVIHGQIGIRPSDVAALRGVHPSWVTRQLSELERAGYVVATPDPSDRRASLLELTPAGVAEMLRLEEVGLARFAGFLTDWEGADVRLLTSLLERLNASMTAAGEREGASARPRQVREHGGGQEP